MRSNLVPGQCISGISEPMIPLNVGHGAAFGIGMPNVTFSSGDRPAKAVAIA
jgi:hypothetical protein